MKEPYESYPLHIVILFILVSLLVFFSGLYLLYLIYPLLSLVFLLYLIYLEVSIYREGCRYCYYYGKRCAFLRGKIVKLFLKKGDPKKFSEKTVSFKDFIPNSLVNIIPLIAGIYLLIKDFNWIILIIAIYPVIILFIGNPILFGKLACPRCKQAVNCPVCEFFKKRELKKE